MINSNEHTKKERKRFFHRTIAHSGSKIIRTNGEMQRKSELLRLSLFLVFLLAICLGFFESPLLLSLYSKRSNNTGRLAGRHIKHRPSANDSRHYVRLFCRILVHISLPLHSIETQTSSENQANEIKPNESKRNEQQKKKTAATKNNAAHNSPTNDAKKMQRNFYAKCTYV